MTKKEIKKKGYTEIITNNRPHQEVYEELKTTRPAFNKTIAAELGDIPSAGVRAKWQIWLYIYIGLLAIMALLRVLTLLTLINANVKPIVLLIASLLALVMPAIGIYGAFKYKMELLKSTSFIIAIFAIRELGKITLDAGTSIGLGLIAAVVILGLVIPYKMKTPFKTSIVKNEIGGKTVTDYDIQFEDDYSITNDELLDSDL
jgi:hypothetical protein